MAGYAFAKYRFPGSRLLFSITLGAIMIPLTALAIPTYLLFARYGLVNTPFAVIIPSLVSPFGVYLMRVYAQDAIPDTLIEAARVDGAGEFRIFWQVGIPLLGPGMVTVLLFTLVATWNNYFLPLIMLNRSSLYPLTVGLAQLQSQSAAGGGAQAVFSTVITGSLLSIIPLIVAFLFLQRYWQTGLADRRRQRLRDSVHPQPCKARAAMPYPDSLHCGTQSINGAPMEQGGDPLEVKRCRSHAVPRCLAPFELAALPAPQLVR